MEENKQHEVQQSDPNINEEIQEYKGLSVQQEVLKDIKSHDKSEPSSNEPSQQYRGMNVQEELKDIRGHYK